MLMHSLQLLYDLRKMDNNQECGEHFIAFSH